jgi:hypothetical protein
MKLRFVVTTIAASLWLGCALPAAAQGITVAADDTIEKLLSAQLGKRVSLKLGADNEITGTVKAVTPNVIHLTEIAGRELFEAVVDLKSVQVIFIRVRR